MTLLDTLLMYLIYIIHFSDKRKETFSNEEESEKFV